jgi:hypothetical protein
MNGTIDEWIKAWSPLFSSQSPKPLLPALEMVTANTSYVKSCSVPGTFSSGLHLRMLSSYNGLHPEKPTTGWKYHKSKTHLIHVTYWNSSLAAQCTIISPRDRVVGWELRLTAAPHDDWRVSPSQEIVNITSPNYGFYWMHVTFTLL